MQRVTEALSSIEGLYPCIGFALQATGLVADEAGKHCDISQFFIQNGESSSSSKKPPTSPSHTPVNELTTPSSRLETSSPANEAHPKKGSILEFYSKQQHPSPSPPTTINKRKSGPLDQFCKRNNQHNNQHNNEEDDEHWTCDKCFKRIPIDAVEEHTDYHFALDLQLEERNMNHSNVVRSVKRPKVEQDKAQKHLFFQPR